MNDSPVKVNLDVKADLTKPAEDITAIAKDSHKGIGKLIYALFGPMIENRIGQARRIATQADKDCRDIIDGKKVLDKNSGMVIPISEVSSVDALCSELVHVDSDCKAKRLKAAMLEAALEISNIQEEEISDEPLNQTFFNHWRAEAELIDEEDLRKFWAHLLVEETKKPNSISPRTLDVAKNLSRDEAELFTRISQGVVGNSILVNEKGEPVYGTYSEILLLQDAGLLGAISYSTLKAILKDKQNNNIIGIPFFCSVLQIVFKRDTIHYQDSVLTKAGRELYNIIKKPLNLDQIIRIAEEISHKNQNASEMIFPWKSKSKESNSDNIDVINDTPLWTNRPSTSVTEGEEK